MPDSVVLRPLAHHREYKACELLQKRAWDFQDVDVIPKPQLIAAQCAGGLVLGAFDSADRLIGFCYGFLGRRWGALLHYSQMLAVDPDHRRGGLALRLKRYQRQEALRQGLELMAWTFDPLEARNAGLNLRRLGAIGIEYEVDFYGPTSSALHAGLPTDRLMVRWELLGEGTLARLEDRVPLAPAGIPVLQADRAGTWPQPRTPDLSRQDLTLSVAVPARTQELKQADSALARAWRESTRAVFVHYLARGYRAVDFQYQDPLGFYTLTRESVA